MNHTEAEPQRSAMRGLLRFLRDLLVIVVIAFTVSFLLKTFLVRSFYIPSGSMLNTLEINDRILVNQLVPDVMGVERGDVVVFRDPGGWLSLPQSARTAAPSEVGRLLQTLGLAADTSSDYVVKRVIGIGGDRVECCDADGRMLVNGVPLEEPYVLLGDGRHSVSDIDFDVTVPAGSLWVMGDNRYSSMDSRYHQDEPGHGFVSESEVVGKAFVRNWPLSRIGWLDNYADTFTGVTEAAERNGANADVNTDANADSNNNANTHADAAPDDDDN